MFMSSPLYNKAGKCNALKDAKGIIEFYLGVHTFIKKKKKAQAVLCTYQTRITIPMTDTAGVSQLLVFHQVLGPALPLGIILGKSFH